MGGRLVHETAMLIPIERTWHDIFGGADMQGRPFIGDKGELLGDEESFGEMEFCELLDSYDTSESVGGAWMM